MSSASLKVRFVPTRPIYTDKGSGAEYNIAIYEPIFPNDDVKWGFLGHTALRLPPGKWDLKTDLDFLTAIAPMGMLVSSDDSTVLGQVVENTDIGQKGLLYTDQHSGGDLNLEIYAFKAQNNADQLAVGLFAQTPNSYGSQDPTTTPIWQKLRVVHKDYLQSLIATTSSNDGPVKPGMYPSVTKVWDDHKSGAHGDGAWQDITVWSNLMTINCVTIDTFFACQGYHDAPMNPVPGPYGLISSKVSLEGQYVHWMAENASQLKDKPFANICLPGTHDSGTYYLQNELATDYSDDSSKKGRFYEALDIIREISNAINTIDGLHFLNFLPFKFLSDMAFSAIHGISTAQYQSVLQQLVSGIRCLDLRVYRYENELYIGHGLLGSSLRAVFSQVKYFLELTQGEVVYITLGHWTRFHMVPKAPGSDTLVPEKPEEFEYLVDIITSIFEADDIVLCNYSGSTVTNDFFAQTYGQVVGTDNPRSKVLFTWDMDEFPDFFNSGYYAQFKQYFFPQTYSPPSGGISGGAPLPSNATKPSTPGIYGFYTNTEDAGTMLEAQRDNFVEGAYKVKLPLAVYITLTPDSDSTIKRVAIPIMLSINEKLSGLPSFLEGIVEKIEEVVENKIKSLLNIQDMSLTWKTLHDLYTSQPQATQGPITPPFSLLNDFEKLVSYNFNLDTPGYPSNISILYTDFYHETPIVPMAVALSLSPQVYVLAMASQHSDGTGQAYDFYHKTVKVYWDAQRSGKLILCSKSDGTGQIWTDDQMTLSITTAVGRNTVIKKDYNVQGVGITGVDPIDLSEYMDWAVNTVEITLTNLTGKNYGNSNYFIVHV